MELVKTELRFERQKRIPITYDGHLIESGYRVDLLVEDSVIVELKAVNQLDPIFIAQLLTYLKLSGCKTGLLINFNVRFLPDGLKRVVYGFADPVRRVRR
jgi:GxxExxY protein